MPKELLLVVEISKVVLAGLEPLRIVARERSPGPTARVPRVARRLGRDRVGTPENQATIRADLQVAYLVRAERRYRRNCTPGWRLGSDSIGVALRSRPRSRRG
jgi:hypothetical protein